MKMTMLRAITLGFFASLILVGFTQSRTQYSPPVGCIGLSTDECNEATELLRDYIRQSPEALGQDPEKLEIASDSELARIRSLYPTRKGHWLSKATFVLFLEPRYGTLHTCAPSQVILTTEAIKSKSNMAYIAGSIEGAGEGTNQQMLFNASKD